MARIFQFAPVLCRGIILPRRRVIFVEFDEASWSLLFASDLTNEKAKAKETFDSHLIDEQMSEIQERERSIFLRPVRVRLTCSVVSLPYLLQALFIVALDILK
jgi:hypothetical protein